jgi:hypothetical protein
MDRVHGGRVRGRTDSGQRAVPAARSDGSDERRRRLDPDPGPVCPSRSSRCAAIGCSLRAPTGAQAWVRPSDLGTAPSRARTVPWVPAPPRPRAGRSAAAELGLGRPRPRRPRRAPPSLGSPGPARRGVPLDRSRRRRPSHRRHPRLGARVSCRRTRVELVHRPPPVERSHALRGRVGGLRRVPRPGGVGAAEGGAPGRARAADPPVGCPRRGSAAATSGTRSTSTSRGGSPTSGRLRLAGWSRRRRWSRPGDRRSRLTLRRRPPPTAPTAVTARSCSMEITPTGAGSRSTPSGRTGSGTARGGGPRVRARRPDPGHPLRGRHLRRGRRAGDGARRRR